MDNITTGSFIKELRKEKNMTQKQLADLLHITDRAVSKWERGVCAPDISLLEPLAEILEVSIVELIQGERAEAPQEAEASAKEIISYSQNEVRRKVRGVQKKYLLIAALVLALRRERNSCWRLPRRSTPRPGCLFWTRCFPLMERAAPRCTASG